MNATTQDGFLNGRLLLRQPAKGFRAGLDAVMLAAAVPARAGDDILELGSGVGTASLCLAARVDGCSITGLEIDADLVALANANAEHNSISSYVRFVEGNALDPPSPLRRAFNHVFTNPPFHAGTGEMAPDTERALAVRDNGQLGDWLKSALKRAAPGGTMTAIIRGDRLMDALAALPAQGMSLLPLCPHADAPAKRIIIRVRKEARTPLALMAGLVLHDAGGRYTPEADAILRDGAPLALG